MIFGLTPTFDGEGAINQEHSSPNCPQRGGGGADCFGPKHNGVALRKKETITDRAAGGAAPAPIKKCSVKCRSAPPTG